MEAEPAADRTRQPRAAVVVEDEAHGLERVAVVVGGRRVARDLSRWLIEGLPCPADTGAGDIGERFGRFSRPPAADFFRP
jgi:hypothetical protein